MRLYDLRPQGAAKGRPVTQLDERCVLTSVTVWQVPGWFNAVSDRPGAAVFFKPTLWFVVIGAFSLN